MCLSLDKGKMACRWLVAMAGLCVLLARAGVCVCVCMLVRGEGAKQRVCRL